MKNLLRLEPVIDTVYKIVSECPARRVPEDADETILWKMLTDNPTHFEVRDALADLLTDGGKVGEACQLRLDGCMLVSELLDEADDDILTLDWEDLFTAQALSLVYDSAMDHFMIGDFEMATAMLELLTDRDPEDHLNAAELLAFCYAALEEWELFDEVIGTLPVDLFSTRLAKHWASFRRVATASPEIRDVMRNEDLALYKEWTAEAHDISPEYLADIESRRPTAGADARRLWLRTESLWRAFPEFIAYLKA